MEILSIILGILGLIATLLGLGFAYVTYVSPIVRFQCYLKNAKDWKLIFHGVEGQSSFYQLIKHPEFIIEETSNVEWTREEPWMKKIIRPAKKCFSYQIALKVNGNIIHIEHFLSMDGGRIYVPIPRTENAHTENEEDNVYYYEKIQALLAGILGKYHIYETLEKFCEAANIQKKD